MWPRKKKEPVDEGSFSVLNPVAGMTLDEQMTAAENVMACRDAASLFMEIIHDHRSDGHECLPYCMPLDLHEQLEVLDIDELKAIFTIVLKDVYDAYYRSQLEEA